MSSLISSSPRRAISRILLSMREALSPSRRILVGSTDTNHTPGNPLRQQEHQVTPESNHDDTIACHSDTSTYSDTFLRCASGVYCNTPQQSAGGHHNKCKKCECHMHGWCRGVVDGMAVDEDDFENEYCMQCSKGVPHPHNFLHWGYNPIVFNEEEDGTPNEFDASKLDDHDENDDDLMTICNEGDEEEEDDDNNEHHDKWTVETVKWNDITLNVTRTSLQTMKELMQVSVSILRSNLRLCKGSQHFRNSEPSIESQNAAVFLDQCFFKTLLEIINENETKAGHIKKTTMEELELFFWAILVCCYYGHSPSSMWDDKDGFPHFTKAINALGGIMVFKHIIASLKSPKAHFGTSWDNYFDSCRHIRKLEKILSSNSSAMLNHRSIRNVEVDDDKLRFRSRAWDALGVVRRKGIKSFGPVFNILSHNPTGLFLSGVLSSFQEKVDRTMSTLLMRYTDVNFEEEVDLNGGIFNGDRAYEYNISKINANCFNTTKRSKSLPFTFGNCNSQTKEQFNIPQEGCQTIYSATMKDAGNNTKQLVAYRNGTGGVVLFITTTMKEYKSTNWTAVFASRADERAYQMKTFQACDFRKYICRQAEINEITMVQGYYEWRVGRNFKVTSVVDQVIVRLLVKHHPDKVNNDMRNFIQKKIGISVNTANDAISDTMDEYKNMSTDELNRFKVSELKQICSVYGKKKTGKKKDLIQRIKEGPVPMEQSGTILDEIVKCWFLKPVKSRAMKLGSMNEKDVLQAVHTFIDLHAVGHNVRVQKGPLEFGLVARKQENLSWLATSVDGIVELLIGDEPYLAPVEIKTFSGNSILDYTRGIKMQMGTFISCDFGDDIFQKVVKDVGYRMQVLHHALVFQTRKVLFVAADSTKIQYCVLISITEDQRLMHQQILSTFVNLHLKWIFRDDEPFPRDKLSENGLTSNKYHIDRQCIEVQYGLSKCLHREVIKRGCPFPRCAYIAPTAVAWWNFNKGYVDVISRYLSHLKAPFRKADPTLQIVVRFCLYGILNGYLSTRYENMDMKMLLDDSMTFDDIKAKLANQSTFRSYVLKVMNDFQVPSFYSPTFSIISDEANGDRSREDCCDKNPGKDFTDFPMDRKLTDVELQNFQAIVTSKKTWKKTFFIKPGLGRKIRMSKEYCHKNFLQFTSSGTDCILCHGILNEKENCTTTRGCVTCCVPLCSASNKKFLKPEDSCEYLWHNVLELQELEPPRKVKKEQKRNADVDSEAIIESEPKQRRRKRQR